MIEINEIENVLGREFAKQLVEVLERSKDEGSFNYSIRKNGTMNSSAVFYDNENDKKISIEIKIDNIYRKGEHNIIENKSKFSNSKNINEGFSLNPTKIFK